MINAMIMESGVRIKSPVLLVREGLIDFCVRQLFDELGQPVRAGFQKMSALLCGCLARVAVAAVEGEPLPRTGDPCPAFPHRLESRRLDGSVITLIHEDQIGA